jgi:hypothetical protein
MTPAPGEVESFRLPAGEVLDGSAIGAVARDNVWATAVPVSATTG